MVCSYPSGTGLLVSVQDQIDYHVQYSVLNNNIISESEKNALMELYSLIKMTLTSVKVITGRDTATVIIPFHDIIHTVQRRNTYGYKGLNNYNKEIDPLDAATDRHLEQEPWKSILNKLTKPAHYYMDITINFVRNPNCTWTAVKPNFRTGGTQRKTYEKMTVKELQQRAHKRGIAYTGLKKSELIDKLRRPRK